MNHRSYVVATLVLTVIVFMSSIVPGFSLATHHSVAAVGPTDQTVQVWFSGNPTLTTMPPTFYELNVAAETSSGLWITSLHWDFGDGSSADVPFSGRSYVSDVRYHQYSEQGVYTVTVTAYDNIGNFGTAQKQVNWSDPGVADTCGSPTITLFTPEINGLSVTVNGVTLPGGSGCSISSISWNWGDGSSSTNWFPATHSYTASGTYTITVTTQQSDGATVSSTTNVNMGGQPNQSPCGSPTITLFSPTITDLQASVNGVTLPGTPSCTITSISWSWGDGTSSTSWFPATHTYSTAGTYSVTATTQQSDGQTASASTTVTIGSSPQNCNNPTISLQPATISGSSVMVNGVTMPGGSGCTITSISWSWGDGSPLSNSWFPATHSYAASGVYTITATTYQSDGKTATSSTSVTIGPSAQISLTVNLSMATVTSGQVATVFVSATELNISPEPVQVSFDPSTLPSAVVVTFSPNNIIQPGSGITMKFQTGANGPTPPNTYSITITGSASGATVQSVNFALTVTPSGPPVTGNLEIVVSSQSNNPISGATVTMTSAPSGQTLLTGTTDSMGDNTFQNVLVGQYSVSVTDQGYQPNSGSGIVSSGSTETIDVTLSSTIPNTYLLTTVVALGQGSTIPNCPDGCSYRAGQSVMVSANPPAGDQLDEWLVTGAACSAGSSINPCTFTMPSNNVVLEATWKSITNSYVVMFSEQGLSTTNQYLVWSVTFNGQTESSNSAGNTITAITFNNIPSGAYGFTVTPPAGGYSGSPQSGQLTVNSSTCAVTNVGGSSAACVETIEFSPLVMSPGTFSLTPETGNAWSYTSEPLCPQVMAACEITSVKVTPSPSTGQSFAGNVQTFGYTPQSCVTVSSTLPAAQGTTTVGCYDMSLAGFTFAASVSLDQVFTWVAVGGAAACQGAYVLGLEVGSGGKITLSEIYNAENSYTVQGAMFLCTSIITAVASGGTPFVVLTKNSESQQPTQGGSGNPSPATYDSSNGLVYVAAQNYVHDIISSTNNVTSSVYFANASSTSISLEPALARRPNASLPTRS